MRLRDCQCDKPECPECGPLVALAEQIRCEFEHTQQQARVPDAGNRLVARPDAGARGSGAHGCASHLLHAGACDCGLNRTAGFGRRPPHSAGVVVRGNAAAAGRLPACTIAIAAACWLIIAPAALYFAFSRD